MKLIKLDLLIILISLFILSGCKNPDGIGLDDSNYQNGTQVDTFTVKSQLVADPAVRTDNKFTYNGRSSANNMKLLGYINDPIFGKSWADINTQLVKPDSASFKFPEGGTLDSAVLVLSYADTSAIENTYYGHASTQFNVVVEELSDPLRVDTSYYSNQFFNVKSPAIGGGPFMPNPKGKVYIMDFIKGKPDTLKNVGAQIRIPINKAYATSKFVNAPSNVFSSVENFNNYIKGIKVRVEPFNTPDAGGVVYLNMANIGKTTLSFYYHNATDTVVNTIYIYGGTGGLGGIAQSNYFKHDYTGTPIANLLAGGTNTEQFVYAQSMAGVKTKVNFPYLKSIIKDGKKAINKAELIVTIDPGTDNSFAKPKRIVLNKGLDKAGGFIQIADNDNSDTRISSPGAIYSGFYNSEKQNYSILVTKYVQDILDGKANDDNLFLTFENPAETAERAVFGGPKGPSYSMKLRIIYSDIKGVTNLSQKD